MLRRACVLWSLVAAHAVATNLKRGFVGNTNGGNASCDDPLLLNHSGWYYSYNVKDNFQDPTKTHGNGDCAAAAAAAPPRFTPMHWCKSSLDDVVPDYVNLTFMMGFNEPNLASQCGLPPAEVAKLWKVVMSKWPSSTFVSPATAGNHPEWFDQLFGNCTALYGAEGCRITHMAVHDYSCTPSRTLAYLKDIHSRFGLPVWLTEFSCGDHHDGKPTADHIAFMKEVLPMLDAAPYVYRYAWMAAHDKSGKRGLVEMVDGKARLTELGKLYQTIGTSKLGAKLGSIEHPARPVGVLPKVVLSV